MTETVHRIETHAGPHEEARAALYAVKLAVEAAQRRTSAAEKKTRNAVMQDALELPREAFMDLHGLIELDEDPEDNPYGAYELSEAANLTARLSSTLALAAELVGLLEEGLDL